MRQALRLIVSAGVVVALAVTFAMAQTTPTQPSAAPAPPPAGAGAPPAMSANPPQEKLIDGPVKSVDPMAKTVRVGWFLNLFSTTLAVTDDTHIAIDGEAGALQDIREGDLVKAAYAEQDGKNIAKSIAVTQEETQPKASTLSRSPGSVGSPMGSAPSTKTP